MTDQRQPVTLSRAQRDAIYSRLEQPSAPVEPLSLPALVATLVILVLGCVLIWAVQ